MASSDTQSLQREEDGVDGWKTFNQENCYFLYRVTPRAPANNLFSHLLQYVFNGQANCVSLSSCLGHVLSSLVRSFSSLLLSLSHKQSTLSAREMEKNRQARSRTGEHQIMPGPL